MKSKVTWVLATLVLGLLSGCGGRHSAVGFRLPQDGDVERGRTAFVELQCHRCHTVVDATLAVPHEVDLGPIPLGGEVREIRTDGFLVTSIIHPGHIRARGPRDVTLTPEGESRMPDYTDKMTVRQLVDIVAFLQWKYKVVPGPSPYTMP